MGDPAIRARYARIGEIERTPNQPSEVENSDFLLTFDYDETLTTNHVRGNKSDTFNPNDKKAITQILEISKMPGIQVVILTRSSGDIFPNKFKAHTSAAKIEGFDNITNTTIDTKFAMNIVNVSLPKTEEIKKFSRAQITVIAPTDQRAKINWGNWKKTQLEAFMNQFRYTKERTIFIDDTPENVNAMKTDYLNNENSILATKENPLENIKKVVNRMVEICNTNKESEKRKPETTVKGGKRRIRKTRRNKKTRRTRHKTQSKRKI